MIKADVLVSNKDWKNYISNPNLYLKKKLKKVEKKITLLKKNKLSFNLLLAGSSEIRRLNKKFRKKNKTTDVLSFPNYTKKVLRALLKEPNKIYLGDIIINLTKIIEKSQKQFFFVTFDKIWIHGLTHLLGYRHKSNRDFAEMQRLENRIIKLVQ